MKNTPIQTSILSALLALAAILNPRPTVAATFGWTGTSGTDLFWATAGNWSAGGPPLTVDTATFNNTALTNGPGAVYADNFVTVNTTIASLQYSNNTAASCHNTVLNSGVTLTISNNAVAVDSLLMGSGVNLASTITNTISGSGATLVITNTLGRINIRSTSGGNTLQNSMLDLSGLDTLRAGVARLTIAGDAGALNREVGTLYLAKTNIIVVAGTTAPQINIGDNPSNGQGANVDPTNEESFLYFGKTNAIYADSITVGREKAGGAMLFNSAFTNGAIPSIYIRGASATRVAAFNIADDSALAASNQRDLGIVDLSGGTVDAMINICNVGLGKNGNNTSTFASEVGTLSFYQGTMDVNTLNVGCAFVATSTGIGPIGTVNINGAGTLIVNSSMNLAKAGATPATPSQGTFNINGGTVIVKGSILSGGGTSTINVFGGVLDVTNSGAVVGTLALPISSMTFSNSTINLSPTLFATNVVTASLNGVSGTTNKFNIASMPAFTSYPAQLPFIQFSANAGDLSTFRLGSLPNTVPAYQGYITNDGVSLIYLVMTNGPIGTPPSNPKTLSWKGSTNGVANGNWNTTSLNWADSNNANNPTNYANLTTTGLGDYVQFDDTLTGTANVNLTTTLSPGSLTVTNTLTNYVFTGTGKISGSAGLIMLGTGTLTLTESGGDNYSGGIGVSNGTVIIDNDSSGVSGGLAIASGGNVQLGNNDGNGALPTGTLTDNGGLVFNRANSSLSLATVISGTGAVTNNGTGIVTLTGTSTFTGPTVVNAGILALQGANGAASTISSSSGLFINNGATVQINADNSLGNPGTGGLPVNINAGGTLTGTSGRSSHLRGLLTLNGGTLTVQGPQPAGNQVNNGTWDLNGGVAVNSGPNNSATSIINCLYVVPTGTFTVNPGGTPSGIDLLVTGTLTTGSGGADGGINLTGGGVMVLDNNNTYSHGTTINAGTMQLGMASDATALATPLGASAGSVTINTGGVLHFASSKGVTVANAISDDGTGTLLVSSGTNLLTTANSYSGNTLVLGATLTLNGSGSVGSSASIVLSNATLDASASSSAISTPGSLSLKGSVLNLGANAASLNTLATTNSTLTFAANIGTPAINLTGASGTLTTGGTTNLINLTAVPGFVSYPASITLIKYNAADPGITNANNVLTTLGVKLPTVGNPAGYLTNNAGNNSIDLVLTNGPIPLEPVTWNGSPNGNWDILTTSNWVLTADGTTPYSYQDPSAVTFDDTATGTTNINLTTTVSPASITFNNATLKYTLAGTGKISGTTGLTSQNSGTVVLAETGGDNYSGGVTVNNNGTVIIDNDSSGVTGGVNINSGTVQLGNNDANGVLPSGGVTDNTSLLFNRTDSNTVSSIISGGGVVTNNSGTVTLSGATSSYSGGTTINGGTLRPTGATALGTSGVIVNRGGTLVETGGDATNNPITMAGGTLGVSSVADFIISTSSSLTIADNTTNIIESTDPQNPNANHNIEVDGVLHGAGLAIVMNATNVTSPDGNQGVRFRDTSGSSDFTGTIIYTNNTKGELSVTGAGPLSPVNTGKIILVAGAYDGGNALTCPAIGGYMEFNIRNSGGTTTIPNDFQIVGSGAAVINGLGTGNGAVATLGNLTIGGQELIGYRGAGTTTNTVSFPTVTLTGGNTTFSPHSTTFGAATQAGTDISLGDISETSPSGLIKAGVGNLTLSGQNNYSGNTTIRGGTLFLTGNSALTNSPVIRLASGTLDVSGRANQTLSLISGQKFFGNGTVNGNSLVMAPGSTMSPGTNLNSIGALTVSGTADLQGTIYMKINKGQSPSNDVLTAGTILYDGGTLIITNVGSALAAGDSFTFFSSASISGTFNATNLPVLGGGLVWTNNGVGTWSIFSTGPGTFTQPTGITGFSLNGANIVITGTNGQTGDAYYLLTSTNVAQPLGQWKTVATNVLNANGNFTFNGTNVVAPGDAQQFYILSNTNSNH